MTKVISIDTRIDTVSPEDMRDTVPVYQFTRVSEGSCGSTGIAMPEL